ncbi:MAG: GDCCVxC domain-containing (seleno)protein [Candidatus Hermodarchaeota archaeon]
MCGYIPNCGFEKEETMLICVIFYTCPNCNEMLRPKQGDCCIFCSNGSVKCPPEQKQD